jgi:methylenetetrahydrofolate reductase (NADPH)
MMDTQTNQTSQRKRSSPWHKRSLRRLLQESDEFITVVEVVTSRGIMTERSSRGVLNMARQLSEEPRIAALSITDNPGGNAMLSADTLGTDLIARGQEVIIHLSCKDWNRNALQSRGWGLASSGFNNVLALSGDCPVGGYEGQAAGVFDIDSVALLDMYANMNRGLNVPAMKNGKSLTMQQTDFFMGAVVNNYKYQEREVMPQYFKLAKKIEAGAQFVINQLGYDARKMDELIKYMQVHHLNVPALANVYVLNGTVAKYFHGGRIAGCTVTDHLLAIAQKQAQSPDKQVAIGKGLGYHGAYLGGHLKHEEFVRILEIADSFGQDDWKTFARELRFDRPGEFHYFEPDLDTSLSSTTVNAKYLASKSPESLARAKTRVPLSYRISRTAHDKVFTPGTSGFNLGKRVFTKIDNASPGFKKAAFRVEHALKVLQFDCRDCGDCSLPDIAYLCPESQCAKNQRNGPCGGTRDGMCEVGEKQCIWALAYDRLKPYGEEQTMLDRPVIYKNGSLKGTSAWANTFLGHDHHGKQHQPSMEKSS